MLDKPSGLLTARPPGVGERADALFEMVKERVKAAARSASKRKVWIVHRLDKEVSGLIVFARSERAFAWLKEDFRSKRVRRFYTAVVEGTLGKPGETNSIQSYLVENAEGIVKSVTSASEARRLEAHPQRGEDASPRPPRMAVTHYQVIDQTPTATILRVKLDTGKKNQIRAHLASIGHPIVGDRRYGSKVDPVGRVCLHAAELAFTHAGTGKTLAFKAPDPPEFAKAARASAVSPVALSVAPTSAEPTTDWDHVADWYDDLIDERKSDHHENVIVPGVMRLIAPSAGRRVLDVACGQGILGRALAVAGCEVVGVDASPRLIASAQRHATPRESYVVADARSLGTLEQPPFDAAACVMALMNINPLEPVFAGIARQLMPGGTLVGVILHPAFRAPGQTSWAWDESRDRARGVTQYRRVDGYLSPGEREIVMNPGRAAHGQAPVATVTFHRPIQTYVRTLVDAGFVIEAIEEWPSLRSSQPGPRAAEENRARREIPMFLAFRARLTDQTPSESN